MTHMPVYCCKLTGTGYWYQKTGQCVWPLTPDSDYVVRKFRTPDSDSDSGPKKHGLRLRLWAQNDCSNYMCSNKVA